MTTELRAMCADLANAYEHELNKRGMGCDLITRARALLDQPEPQPPAAGEVVELVAAVQAAYSAHGWVEEKQFVRLFDEVARLATVIEEGCDCSIEGPMNWKSEIEHLRQQHQHPQPVAEGPTLKEISDWIILEKKNGARWAAETDHHDALPVACAAIHAFAGSRFAPQPVAVSERLPGPEDCDAEGNCWWFDNDDYKWCLESPYMGTRLLCWTHWLPANALPTPEANAQ